MHLPQVVDLEKKSFSRPWSLEQLEECLIHEDYHMLVAEGTDGKVLGFGSMVVLQDEGFINNIAVFPSYQKQGVASEILTSFCQFGQRRLVFLTLEVRKSNEAALALYDKFGFLTVGERKDYYEAPRENALVMTRNFVSK